ncbi:serine hydrolase domain-containing protein [Yeosuana aromativorans]|nr:serine hydrolase domain-containing protein [Yeosuana aromativorans]
MKITTLKKAKLLALILILLTSLAIAQIKKIDSILITSAKNNNFSGSVLIAKNGQILYKKVLGYSNQEKNVLNNDQTAFSIASVGKIFTATLIMKYVESGQLKLSEPIKAYLPNLSIPNSDKITIHHLLSHTSGLGNYMEHPLIIEKMNQKSIRIDDIIPLIEDQPLVFDEPGQKHQYSNSGYIILGKIIENLAKKSYSEVLYEELLNPLAMNSTKISIDMNNFKGMAIGYRRLIPNGNWESTMNMLPTPLSDGGIFTTAKDILSFDWALFSGVILKDKTLELMTQQHSEGEQPGFGKIAYGYGLMLDTFEEGIKSVGHNGGSPGYNAEYRHYNIDKDTNYTLIILSNHERVIRPIFFDIQEMILNGKI